MSILSRGSRFSVDKDTSPRALFAHMQKAINAQEVPPKHKHVRAIILETYKQKSSLFLYSVVTELQVLTNQVCCWKFLVVLHKVLRSGYEEASHYHSRKITTLDTIKRTWESPPSRYSKLISEMCRVIAKKLFFHRSFPRIPGDLEISITNLLNVVGKTPDNQFELSVALMDYLETLLRFQPLVFDAIDRSSFASVPCNNCRMFALVQCIQDCASLYDLVVKLMIKLHASMDVEMLAGHRQRFNSEYLVLKHFFKYANSYVFFKSLLKIPLLPEVPPNFLDARSSEILPSLKVTENEEAQAKQDDEWDHQQLIDIDPQDTSSKFSDELVEDKIREDQLPFTFASASNAQSIAQQGIPVTLEHDSENSVLTQQVKELTIPQHEYMLEIEMLKSEIQRLQNENTNHQKLLLDRIKTLEEEIKVIVQVKSKQDDEMNGLSAMLANKTAVSKETEEKYTKIRDAYTKLREEHVNTLRVLGSLQTERNTLQNASVTNGPALEAEVTELQQRITALQVDQVASQEIVRKAEADLSDTKVALQTAEDRASRAEIHSLEEVKRFSLHFLERLCKAVCDRSIVDNQSVSSLLNEQEFVQCRSCAEVVSSYLQKTSDEVKQLETILKTDTSKPEAAEALILNLTHLSSYLSATIVNAKAVSNSAASIEKSDELSALCKRCLEDGAGIFSNVSVNMDEWHHSTVSKHVRRLGESLSRILSLVVECRPQIKDVQAEDVASALEMEMQQTMKLIDNAETRFRELLEKSKTTMTGIQLEVHSEILDSCTELMSAIALLVVKARELQNEIVDADRGSATVKEFYKRHSRWTEGLFSAAKSVGAGANFLVSTADAIVTGQGGKLEQLVVAALEISSCTTQLLVASRVKASTGSLSLGRLESAAKEVSKMTGKVVAGANSASTISQQSENMEFTQLNFTQARKAEVDSQVRVLELESSLNVERQRLAEIRRFNYSNSAEVERKS